MIVTTTAFRALTDEVANSLGLPDARIVEVAHPLGGADEEAVRMRADAAVEETLRLLTRS